MANIQISSLRHVDALLDGGCTDCRTPTLMSHFDSFSKAIGIAMRSDPEIQSERLDPLQISSLGQAIEGIIGKFADLRLPDALVHRDLSGGNIQVTESRYSFLDWAQACIGPPFICLDYMQVHAHRLAKAHNASPYSVTGIAESYTSPWLEVLTDSQVRAARDYSPLLAQYLYVTPMDGRSALDLLDTQRQRAILRSMARRMQAETASPRLQQLLRSR
jgi:hypothetical protein